MYEHQTSERILKRMLDNVDSKFDTREGSIIFDTLAPLAIELQEAYLSLDFILQQTFASTANREWLKVRAEEFNIYPEPATASVVLAQFSMDIPIGTRFNREDLNFIVTELVSNEEHTYKMECETLGKSGNDCIGDIIPIVPMDDLKTARITKLITPAEDEEETEIFRARYFRALKDKSFGGNGDAYKKEFLKIDGVGGVKTWRSTGGGRVRCVIINSEYASASIELVQNVQKLIDPTESHAQGDGVAPIGHTVTVESVKSVPINVEIAITPTSGHRVEEFQTSVEDVVRAYLLERAKEWTTQDEKQVVIIRTAFILAEVLKLPHIMDISQIRVNGRADRVMLEADEIGTMGRVTISQGV